MSHLLPLVFLLGLVSLDATAVGQFMVSRPIVVGPLVGALMGDTGLGLALGALCELIWMADLPVGAHLPIDLTLLAGVATAMAVELTHMNVGADAAITYSICVVIPLAALASEAENLMRKFNIRLVRGAQQNVESGRLDRFEWINAIVLLALFLKACLTAFLALQVAHAAIHLFAYLPAEVGVGMGYAPWFLMAVGCASAIDLLVDPRHLLPLFLSAAVSATLILFLRVPAVYLLPASLFLGFLLSVARVKREEGRA